MSGSSWQALLISAQTAGTQLSNSTVATSVLPTQAKATLPANALSIGTVLRVTVGAQISNVVTTPGTLTLDLRFGSIVVFTSGAINLSTTAHTNAPAWYQILLTCRSVGSGTAATLMGQGYGVSLAFNRTAVADGAANYGTAVFPATTPAVGTGFDSTVSNVIDHFATFSVNTNPTNYTLQIYAVEVLN